VCVDARETKILEWRGAQRGEDRAHRGRWSELAAAHAIQQLLEVGSSHQLGGYRDRLNRQYNHGLCMLPASSSYDPA
jgi:hypothetical protein